MRDIKYEIKKAERDKITKMIEERNNPENNVFNNIQKIKEEERKRKIEYIEKECLSQADKEREYRKLTRDIKPDCLLGGWVLYLIIMIFGTIFRGYILLAIGATIYFFVWRHNKIEEANGRKYDD